MSDKGSLGEGRRLRACVEAWPECESGAYDPRCCRFPKSCSCTAYDLERLSEADLEPPRASLIPFRYREGL